MPATLEHTSRQQLMTQVTPIAALVRVVLLVAVAAVAVAVALAAGAVRVVLEVQRIWQTAP